MKFRLSALVGVLLMVVACAPEPAPAPEPEAPPMTDEQAIDALRAAYAEHYNLGHADVVADLYAEDAALLPADGSVNLGRPAIAAALAQELTMSPTLSIADAETMVMGDSAVEIGTYSVSMATPEGGEPMGSSGSYLTVFQRVGDAWKIGVLIGNNDAPPTAGMPAGAMPMEVPPDLVDSPVAGLTAAYAEHFNLGHADVVAGLYDEDAVAAFADSPMAEGRDAIAAALAERMAMGSPQITIHTVDVTDLGGGWFASGGWYEITATVDGAASMSSGKWLTLVRTDADGTQRIHWAVTNADPMAE